MFLPWVVLMLSFSDPASALSAGQSPLVGTWRLASWKAVSEEGRETYPFGHDAAGRLIYDAEGRMSLQLSRKGRSRYADAAAATDEELAAALRGFFSCYGTYTLDPDGATVRHHIEVASNPNWEGAEQVRLYEFSGDVLVLRTAPLATNVTAQPARHELRWERLSPSGR